MFDGPPHVLKTTLATLALAAALPAHAGPLVDDATRVAMPTTFWAATRALPEPTVPAPRADDPLVASDAVANLTTISGEIRLEPSPSALVATATEATSSMRFKPLASAGRPRGALDAARATPVPDPGTLQVFGLGLVILATVAGTQRRKSV